MKLTSKLFFCPFLKLFDPQKYAEFISTSAAQFVRLVWLRFVTLWSPWIDVFYWFPLCVFMPEFSQNSLIERVYILILPLTSCFLFHNHVNGHWSVLYERQTCSHTFTNKGNWSEFLIGANKRTILSQLWSKFPSISSDVDNI